MKSRNQAPFLSIKNKEMTQRSFSERKKYATCNNHLSKNGYFSCSITSKNAMGKCLQNYKINYNYIL